ncbi:MAG TPA: helix-turn-helix domain-containing protein [Chloroflexota bacterium]|nr:helix-turn-helix domain-containing protein [Chloroflexota bacterium]
METTAAAQRYQPESPESLGSVEQPEYPAQAVAARPVGSPARLRPRGGFGGYLHELRRERALTVRHLASGAGVHHTYVSKLERGDRQAPEEPVVEALAAALGATPAQLDQLRWRAGLTPRGVGVPGNDDPTLTLVAEALGSPVLTDGARDQLRQAIAQAVHRTQGPQSTAWQGTQAPHWPQTSQAPHMAQAPQVSQTPSIPQAPVLSPDAPADPRGAMLAGLMGGWQTMDEAAAELRVTSTYLLSLVQAGQLRAWALPGGGPGSLVGLRLKREDLLALLQPVRL